MFDCNTCSKQQGIWFKLNHETGEVDAICDDCMNKAMKDV